MNPDTIRAIVASAATDESLPETVAALGDLARANLERAASARGISAQQHLDEARAERRAATEGAQIADAVVADVRRLR